jgi:hypothetical protein
MRQELLDYIRNSNIGTFKVSKELPFDTSDIALYVKNPKSIYVSVAQTEETTLIATLGALSIVEETTAHSVYFTSDAKQLPANYSEVVNVIKDAVKLAQPNSYNRAEAAASTEFIDDLLVTVITINFIKIK